MVVTEAAKENTLRNWMVQSAGAEVLRLANIMMLEKSVEVCCPVHDSVLAESSIGDSVAVAETIANCMRDASQIVLGGPVIRTEQDILQPGKSLIGSRGLAMWRLINEVKNRLRYAA